MKKMKMKKKKLWVERKLLIVIMLFVLVFISVLPSVIAVADFDVNSFSCTPTEVVINDVFSCTAQIKNNGDIAGSVSVATLYPDSNNWLDDSNYPQSSGTSVSPGQTTEVIFTGLKATKSGSNGFSKIMLDSVTDTYVSDQNVRENVINVAVSVSNSVSSAAQGDSFDVTADVVAGGNIDVVLTFVVNSGGCSIGDQDDERTISNMQNGNSQSRTWSVTQGTSGDCSYTISASATGAGGIASKTDSDSSSVTCSDCSSGDDPDSPGGPGGGGGGGGGGVVSANIYTISDVNSAQSVDLAEEEAIQFILLDKRHTITLTEVTNTEATVNVDTTRLSYTLAVGDKISIDLDNDGMGDFSMKLKSINLVTDKANFVVVSLVGESVPATVGVDEKGELVGGETGGLGEVIKETSLNKILIGAIIFFVILAIIGAYFAFIRGRNKKWK